MVYAGIDLHKRCPTLCVLDSHGNVLREHRRDQLVTRAMALRPVLAAIRRTVFSCPAPYFLLRCASAAMTAGPG